MRALMIATGVLLMLGYDGSPVRQAEVMLVSGPYFLSSGDNVRACFDAPAGTLLVAAAAPPGRTGEMATLTVEPEGDRRDGMRLVVPLTPIEMQSEHRISGGRYCWALSITDEYPDVGNPNRPDRPYKHVALTIAHRP